MQDKAAAFPDQHQGYNGMSHARTYGSNTSIFTLSNTYYSAQVPETVKSVRSVSEIIHVLYCILVFTILSILVLIFNPTDFTEVWRSLILAFTSICRWDSRKMSSERLSLCYFPLLLYYISLHTTYYQEEIMQCLPLFQIT